MSATSQKSPPLTTTEPNVGRLADKRYRLQKGRRLNAPLAIGSAAVLVCLSAAGFAWHRHQQAKMYGAMRQRATALADAKDWRRAADYWQRYLWLAPNDVEARMNLIDAVEQGAVTPRDRRRLSLMLHESIGLLPDDQAKLQLSLRVRVAKNHFAVGDMMSAYQTASDLLEPKDGKVGVDPNSEDAIAMRRIRAITATELARSGRESEVERTGDGASVSTASTNISLPMADEYITAAQRDNPGDEQLARAAAGFFLRHRETFTAAMAVPRADEIMNELVAARPQDADALIARYQYRVQRQHPDAPADLSAALELEPDHFVGLLLKAGSLVQNDKDYAGAIALARQAIQKKPSDSRGYVALAELEAAQGRWSAAAAAIQQGRRAIGASDLSMDNLLTFFLIQSGDFEGGANSLAQLEESFQAKLPELNIAYRRNLQNQMQLMRARLAVAGDDLHGAAVLLKGIVAGAQQGQLGQLTPLGVQAKELLAKVMERLGYWDVAAAHWLDLARAFTATQGEGKAEPQLSAATGEATLRAATTLLAAGHLDQAIQQADRYLSPPTDTAGKPAWVPAPEACLVLLKAHLKKQIQAAAQDRSWMEFSRALELAKKLDPPRVDACVAEFEYFSALGGNDGKRSAAEALAAGEDRFANDLTFWRAAALGYQNLGRADDAARALARFDALESNPARRAQVHVQLAIRNSGFEGAENVIADALVHANEEERLELQLLRVNLLLSHGFVKDAKKLITGLIATAKPEARLLTAGMEVALRAREFDDAEAWEAMLAAAAPTDDFTPRYFRARRLLDQFEKLSAGERAEVELLVRDVRSARPAWGDAAALTARLAELQNNRPKAIDDYRLAASLGSSMPGVLERLIALLYAEGQYDVADQYFSRISDKVHSNPEMESLAIATALRRNDVPDAIATARKAVEVHPDDPVRQIWLANLLAHEALARELPPVEAEEAFRSSLSQFPRDVRVWSAFIMLLHRSQQFDKAKQVLDEFAATMGDGSWDRHFVAARAYQLLGDVPRAIQEADAACKLKPKNVTGRVLLAKLLMSTDVTRAEAEFVKVHSLDQSNGEARRHLAILWSASGNAEDQKRAMELLEKNPNGGAAIDEIADSRLRAALLSRQGRNLKERRDNLTEAREAIEQLVERRGPAAEDVDRLLLASIYEQEAWLNNRLPLLQAAREQWQYLVGRDGAPMSYTLQYTDFLLRQLARSLDVSDDQVTTKEWEVLREVITEDAKGRIVELDRQSQQEVAPVDLVALLSCRVRLLHATEQSDLAAATIADFTKKELPAIETEVGQARAWLTIARLYSAVGAHAEAEEWFRRVTEIEPEHYVMLVNELSEQGRTDDAIEACLTAFPTNAGGAARAATVLATLVSAATTTAANAERVDAVIAEALHAHGDDVELLMAVAVLNVTRKNDSEAIRYFRRVAELAPTNAVALNNLATLLAEHSSDRREALELINRAIEASGRQPHLLDTLGTIQLRSGEYVEAVANLEEAVARGGADPRYQFHLAAAYHGAKQIDEAREALRRARQWGLDDSILTQGDQELLQELERGLGTTNTSPTIESRTEVPESDLSRQFQGLLPLAA